MQNLDVSNRYESRCMYESRWGTLGKEKVTNMGRDQEKVCNEEVNLIKIHLYMYENLIMIPTMLHN
jgi:hypothetical protein